MSDNESDSPEEVKYQIVFLDEPLKVYSSAIRDGRATAKFPNGDTYAGDYLGGKRHGSGVYTFASGARYEGQYVENKKEGKGRFTSPDKSVYEGDYQNDKRHGQGTYLYANGDEYTGGFLNDLKHGPGVYKFKDAGTLSGTWSRGKCVHGEWVQSDGSKFIGQWEDNKPQGAGWVALRNGASQSGKYDAGAWIKSQFEKPHVSAKGPAPVVIDPVLKAQRIIDKAKMKTDHFEAIYRLKKEYEGVPNYRKADGFPVFGCGQPSLDGFRLVLDAVREMGLSKEVVWINLRADPVVYVNNASYSPRNPKVLNENLELANLTVADLKALDTYLQARVRRETKRHGAVFHFLQDTFSEVPALRQNLDRSDVVEDPEHIRTLSDVYELLNSEEFEVQFQRLANTAHCPTTQEIDALATALRAVDPSTVVFLNCQMGKGRTTTGMVLACLLKKAMQSAGAGEDDENKPAEEEPNLAEYNSERPDFKLGQFQVVMELCAALVDKDGQNIGHKVKAELDEVIDRNSQMAHLRECISQAGITGTRAAGDEQLFYQRLVRLYLRRYFLLICFNAHLKLSAKVVPAENETPQTFTDWLQSNPFIVKLLEKVDQFVWQ